MALVGHFSLFFFFLYFIICLSLSVYSISKEWNRYRRIKKVFGLNFFMIMLSICLSVFFLFRKIIVLYSGVFCIWKYVMVIDGNEVRWISILCICEREWQAGMRPRGWSLAMWQYQMVVCIRHTRLHWRTLGDRFGKPLWSFWIS